MYIFELYIYERGTYCNLKIYYQGFGKLLEHDKSKARMLHKLRAIAVCSKRLFRKAIQQGRNF